MLGFFFMKERDYIPWIMVGKGELFYLSLAKRIPSRLARKPKAIINEDVARST